MCKEMKIIIQQIAASSEPLNEAKNCSTELTQIQKSRLSKLYLYLADRIVSKNVLEQKNAIVEEGHEKVQEWSMLYLIHMSLECAGYITDLPIDIRNDRVNAWAVNAELSPEIVMEAMKWGGDQMLGYVE